LFIAFSNLTFLKLHSSQLNTDKKVSVEYLEKLPTNDYIIGPGDSLNINISSDIGLSSTARIDGEGTIYLPKLGRVFVNGLTINELNSVLNEAYLKFLKFPKVQTIVTKYRPIKVFVTGEVVNPGIQTMQGSLSTDANEIVDNTKGDTNLEIFSNQKITQYNYENYYFPTVFDAIRSSGGITQFSDLQNVQIIRNNSITNGSGKIRTTLNLNDLLSFGDVSQNIRIYDQDVIIVERNNESNKNLLTRAILSKMNPKFIEVYVSGRVNRPGMQKVSRAGVLSDAIDMAGGAKALKGPVTFVRFEADGSIDKRKIRFTKNKRGKYENPNLRDGDLIIVGDNIITTANEVVQEFTSPFVGIFSTYGLIKAISD